MGEFADRLHASLGAVFSVSKRLRRCIQMKASEFFSPARKRHCVLLRATKEEGRDEFSIFSFFMFAIQNTRLGFRGMPPIEAVWQKSVYNAAYFQSCSGKRSRAMQSYAARVTRTAFAILD